MRIIFSVDKGTDVIEFNYKMKHIDFVWRSPIGLSSLSKIKNSKKDDQLLHDSYTCS